MKPILSDALITLRALDPADLDAMFIWENDTSLWDVGNTIAPFSRHQLWEYLQNYDGNIYKTGQLRLMVELKETHEVIGTVDFYDFDAFNNRAFLGLLIDEKYKGKGYGKRTLSLMLKYAFDFLGINQCLAYIPEDNKASYNLFKSSGFEEVGTVKQWLKIGGKYRDAFLVQHLSE